RVKSEAERAAIDTGLLRERPRDGREVRRPRVEEFQSHGRRTTEGSMVKRRKRKTPSEVPLGEREKGESEKEIDSHARRGEGEREREERRGRGEDYRTPSHLSSMDRLRWTPARDHRRFTPPMPPSHFHPMGIPPHYGLFIAQPTLMNYFPPMA
ncbi:hypothetical protein PMAYCL1PPCAC_26840, partial [Pristionchus mayeri]